MSDLFSQHVDVDEQYAFIRDHLPGLRAVLMEEWSLFQDLADPDFEKQLPQDFESRAWEMRVGALLRRLHGRNAVSSSRRGLDFRVEAASTVWVECVAPTSGDGPAAVRPVATGPAADWIDDEGVTLRYSSAIWDKWSGQIGRETRMQERHPRRARCPRGRRQRHEDPRRWVRATSRGLAT